MTDLPPEPELTEPVPEDVLPAPGTHWIVQTLNWFAGIIILLVLVLVGLRLGVQTDFGRGLVVKLVEGQKLGPVGRLHIEGLDGDVLGDFSLKKLQIIDAKGAWIDANDIAMRWSSTELLARRFHVQSLQASRITLLRQPIQTKQPPGPKGGRLPVAIILDQVRARIETRPEISVKQGLWDLDGRVRVRRNGSAEGLIRAASRLHYGDGVAARFKIGGQDRIELKAEAIEAAGGALAGALGLPVDRSLSIRADADGVMSAAKLRVITRSGGETPLTIDASWGKDGATIDAFARLTSSSLTQHFAERIGPEGHLTMTSRHTSGDDYLVNLVMNGKFAHATAHGDFNMKTHRAEKMDVMLEADELSKWWVPVPHVGPTRSKGVLTGSLDKFSYKADILAEKIEQNGYTLARLSGPGELTHDKGEFRLVTDLKGEGGAGDPSLLWTLLGARPTAHLDGGRIPDGHFVFHQMKLLGSHLVMEGEGGMGFFGGFGFKGKAVVTGIGLGKAGKGTLTGTWIAALPKGSPAWNLSFEAKGQSLVSGAAEFDRLMGQTPTVTGKADWDERGLEVSHAIVTGNAINADLHGLMNHEGVLAFDMDWNAVGPFGVGPVEIAGAAHGTGKVSGRVDAPRADLAAELTSIDMGRMVVKPAKLELTFIKADHEVDGAVSITGHSNFGDAIAKSAFRINDDGLALHDIAADAGGVKVSGAITLHDGEPSVADLTIAATPGAFLTSGRLNAAVKISGRGADATALVQVDGQNLAAPGMTGAIRRIKLNAKGPLSNLPFDVLAESNDPFAWKFLGGGVYTDTHGPEITLTGGGKVRKSDFKLLEPALIRFAEHDRALRMRFALSGGEAEVDGRQVGDALTAKIKVSGISLQGLTEDYLGVVSGTGALDGHGAHLSGSMDAVLEGARSRDAPAEMAMTTRVTATIADTKLHIDAGARNERGLQSSLVLDLPAEAAADPFRIAIDRTKPVSGTFNAEGELRPLWDLLAGGDRSLSGKVSAHGSLSGPLNKLRATGDATLANGAFHDAATGLDLKDLTIAAAFNEEEVDVRQASATDGHGGVIKGDGTVSMSPDGASTLKLVLNRFQLVDNEIGRAQASGAVTVTRDSTGHAKLAGALTVDRADIAANPPTPTGVVPLKVREVHITAREGEDAPQPRTSPIQVAFDVSIKAPRGIFVRGKGLDAELSLNSHVGGDSVRPDLTGVARLIRGSYDFSGKRFDFDELGTVYLGPTAETIRLDLTAQRVDTSLTAQIRVRGTAAKPEISLTSTPVLPQDEILSRVLFGVSASQLSPFEAAQLASALASLATGGGFDIIGGLRQFAKLDRLSLGVDQTTANLPGVKQATTISGGKYLTDNVYVELTGGGRTGPSAQVEVRIQRNLSVISQIGSQGDARLSVRFRQNYK